MFRIAMAREDGDFVSAVLQTHRSVDDETFCASDAEVGVEEDYTLLYTRHLDRYLQIMAI